MKAEASWARLLISSNPSAGAAKLDGRDAASLSANMSLTDFRLSNVFSSFISLFGALCGAGLLVVVGGSFLATFGVGLGDLDGAVFAATDGGFGFGFAVEGGGPLEGLGEGAGTVAFGFGVVAGAASFGFAGEITSFPVLVTAGSGISVRPTV